ncbi:Norsolorinic acid ketoreductase [Daldinia childiae]|uniref:Norsolorinic acid ketoreductase n=1 Tax=Daldinia childiae TaxID=326645 RepID=UPI001446682E|nr:Norsolorinic acid ketoreductase [Daldinia childiae]KAF3057054.1 Norsolorinic acid ketoreductase [Daldinia childiae]
MENQFVVLITGAGRGIGNALAQIYLSRSNCTVVGSIRDEKASGVTELKASPKGSGSKLLLVKIESSVPGDANRAADEIKAAGIDHIDIVVANAGISPPIVSLEKVNLEDVVGAFNVNAVGAIALYQACHPLLEKSSNAKFVSISSAAGSISAMEPYNAHVAPAYCISKAALNWITMAAHCGNKWLTAIAVNPGLVDTDMGKGTAEYLGLERAPYTKKYSAERIISLIDDASRENSSGKFLNVIDNKEIPW